jgi:glutamyl-tRNA reductase
MEYGVVGTSIWQQNMPLLSRLTVDRENKVGVLQQLMSDLQLGELIYLATCNRVEFIYVTREPQADRSVLHRLIDFFFRENRDLGFFPNDFYHYTGKEAISHLFRMTSSLESLVVGETQITGQFKQAYQEAAEAGLVGPVLGRLAEDALTVAKRVRRETSLGAGSVSMASLAAQEVERHCAGLAARRLALVGSGPMTAKLARHFAGSPDTSLVFVNRTVAKVESLAEEFGGRAISLDDFIACPDGVDAIISATGAKEPVFDIRFLERLKAGSNRVLCIDLAIPRDFSCDFDDDEGVSLTHIQTLKSREQGNLRQKFVEAAKANEIVRDGVSRFLSGRIEYSLKPIFRDCCNESLEVARKALDDLFSRRLTCLDQEERKAVERLVTNLISHSSFQPVRILSDHLVELRSELTLADPAPVRTQAV